MGLASNPALWFLPFATLICIWVAWSDMATMKIPNKAVIALFAVFVIVGGLALPFGDYWPRFIHLIVVLAVTILLSIANVLGAGDAKFAAVMAPFIVLVDVPFVFMLFAICVVFGFITHRLAGVIPPIRKATAHWESWQQMRKFPMGYPLALTLVVYLAITAF